MCEILEIVGNQRDCRFQWCDIAMSGLSFGGRDVDEKWGAVQATAKVAVVWAVFGAAGSKWM